MKWTLILLLGGSLTEIAFGWTYDYSNKTMNWTEARKWCRHNYTDMVVIQSQKENDHLVDLLPDRRQTPYYWIGITKNHKDEPWTWIGNNSTWTGNDSWASGEPNNRDQTEFCVEIYVNKGQNRGKWNDDRCNEKKYPVCYKAQCNETSCGRGRCQEIIEGITCDCEPGFKGDRCQTEQCNATSCGRGRCQEINGGITCDCEPGFKGDRCQTAVECPPPDNGYLSCPGGNRTFNSTCQFKCNWGFLLIGSPHITCGVTGVWSGPRPSCASYKQALLAVAGCGAVSACCCMCCCWMKRRKRKKLAQVREPEEVTSPSTEAQG